MKVYDFKVLLEPDESGGYVVSCPSLAGCYSQGETVEEALSNIREAIELCLEDMTSFVSAAATSASATPPIPTENRSPFRIIQA